MIFKYFDDIGMIDSALIFNFSPEPSAQISIWVLCFGIRF